MHRIVVVEDDSDIAEIVAQNLKNEGYQVHVCFDGDTGWDLIRDTVPHLVVLDLMLPGRSGLDIARLIRRTPETRHIPILVLTARSEEIDVLLSFEEGADDYVSKPFRPKELVARVKALLRRAYPHEASTLHVGTLHIDFEKMQIQLGGRDVALTPTEWNLLKALTDAKGRVLSRSQLLDRAWEYNYVGDPRTVDVHIRRLRQKLGEYASLVETVKGFGYRWRLDKLEEESAR